MVTKLAASGSTEQSSNNRPLPLLLLVSQTIWIMTEMLNSISMQAYGAISPDHQNLETTSHKAAINQTHFGSGGSGATGSQGLLTAFSY